MLERAGPRRLRSVRADALVALAALTVVELEVALEGLGPSSALAAALATLPLALRRRAPALAVQAIAWALVLDAPLGDDWTERANAGVLLLLLAFYSLGAHAPRRRAWAGAGAALAVLLGAELLEGGGDSPFLVWIAAMPWLAGRAVWRYRTRAAELEQLARRLDGERAIGARLAVAEERQRIAAELHDAVGHAVSAMVVQAGAAEETLAERPERARRALVAVRETGQEAVDQLRAMLGVLRAPAEPLAAAAELLSAPRPGWRPRLNWTAGADPVLAALSLAVGAAYAAFDPVMAGVRVPVALLQPLAAAAIAFRSRAPFAALALALTAMAAESALTGIDPETPTPLLAALLSLYSVAAHTARRRAAVAGLLGVAVPCALELTADNGDVADLWVVVPLFWLPWLAGRAARASRGQAERLSVLTERLRRERDARVRLALVEERTRVARELHDSVAHAISVMVLQAGAAEQVLERAPEQARAAARAIEQLGRQALAELGRMLGMLAPDEHRSRVAPFAGLAQLDTLIAHVRQAGLPVELHVNGTPDELPVGVDIFAYRIIQEALTNALKHAGPVPTTVQLDYRRDALAVEVADDGGAGQASLGGAGHGLIGMRERVALYGGTLDAGPRAEGGYAVRARLMLVQESG